MIAYLILVHRYPGQFIPTLSGRAIYHPANYYLARVEAFAYSKVAGNASESSFTRPRG